MQTLKGIGPYGTVGLDMVLAVVVGLLGGRWLDQRFATHGWLTVIGFLFGVAACFNILFKAAKRLREETEREDRQQQAARSSAVESSDSKRDPADEPKQGKSDGDDGSE
ncbi:MAG: AtpZ/AtpI family protein [Deltaproteobacteria bacterium]|nr:AtpZ/AtpI family protein [Deltaproteobacteria bacterium]